ncbi:unnamed protein product [Urochloa humidicola]
MATAEEKVEAILKEVKNLTVGQIKITTTVDDLHRRSVEAEKISADLAAELKSLMSRLEALEALSSMTSHQAPSREEEGRAKGHGDATNNQGTSEGAVTTQNALVKGEHANPKFNSSASFDHTEENGRRSQYTSHPREFKLPKLDFPKFTGENPRVWREKSEKYFAMYGVPVHMWVSFATINFRGNAELWLQSYEAQHNIDNWPDLCVAIEQKFGQDLYQNHMRDLLNIRQTADVLEYAERFETAKHRVLVHNKDMGEVFFVQKFLDGLNYNISNAITLHRPRTVDAALSMALMQEQILEASSRRFTGRAREYSKGAVKPSSSTHSAMTGSVVYGGNVPEAKPVTKQEPKSKWEDKFSALREQRRAQGLCMKCGDKWGKGHRCPKQVPLHILEEVLDAMNVEEQNSEAVDSGTSSDEEILSMSVHAVEGIQGKKTMKLQAFIQNQEILILVDSGSSSTFINGDTAQKLKL